MTVSRESMTTGLDVRERLGLLRGMLRIRDFENAVMKLFSDNLVRGSTHLCQGQEAVSVGVSAVLTDNDSMTCTYRGHGAVLAKGADLEASFAEILGRAGGLCAGKGGSMHFADFGIGALGSNAIVGAQVPIAVGAGLGHSYLGDGSVSVTFMGDGSTNIGAFHEALNLAAIWSLPVVFVIENNLYGEYSPLSTTTPISRLSDRGSSYGMRSETIDGNDVEVVRESAAKAVALARAGDGPTLVEAVTYRQSGHSRADPAAYRPAGELETWLARDPIETYVAKLTRSGAVAANDIELLRSSVNDEVNVALTNALSQAAPSATQLYTDVFVGS